MRGARAPRLFLIAVQGLTICLGMPSLVRGHGDPQDRIDELSRAIAARSTDRQRSLLHSTRAELRRSSGDWRGALDDWRETIRLNPDAELDQYARGRALLDAGRAAEADQALRAHLSRHVEHGAAWVERARALVALELWADAVRCFDQAIGLAEHAAPGLYLERADAIRAQGSDHVLLALRSIEAGRSEIGPAISLELRALELEKTLERYDEALERIARISHGRKTTAPWLVREAEILLLAGRPDEASTRLRRAMADLSALPTERRNVPTNLRLLGEIRALLAATERYEHVSR